MWEEAGGRQGTLGRCRLVQRGSETVPSALAGRGCTARSSGACLPPTPLQTALTLFTASKGNAHAKKYRTKIRALHARLANRKTHLQQMTAARGWGVGGGEGWSKEKKGHTDMDNRW